MLFGLCLVLNGLETLLIQKHRLEAEMLWRKPWDFRLHMEFVAVIKRNTLKAAQRSLKLNSQYWVLKRLFQCFKASFCGEFLESHIPLIDGFQPFLIKYNMISQNKFFTLTRLRNLAIFGLLPKALMSRIACWTTPVKLDPIKRKYLRHFSLNWIQRCNCLKIS